jgi:hypothetical protein
MPALWFYENLKKILHLRGGGRREIGRPEERQRTSLLRRRLPLSLNLRFAIYAPWF